MVPYISVLTSQVYALLYFYEEKIKTLWFLRYLTYCHLSSEMTYIDLEIKQCQDVSCHLSDNMLFFGAPCEYK